VKTTLVHVEDLMPLQRFTEVGLSEAGMLDPTNWYTLEWVNPTNRTFSFRTYGGGQPGSMPYHASALVIIEEQS
jgi:hypothetical protein